MTITHPPLSRAEFRAIVDRHQSPDARRLYCEIERLKAVERLVREALAQPPGKRASRELRQQLLDALAGQLQPPHAFGLLSRRESKAARREQLANELGPMNYRQRASVVAAQAAANPALAIDT